MRFFTILIAFSWVSACGDDVSATAGTVPSADSVGMSDASETTDIVTADTAHDTPEMVQSDDGSTDTTAPQDAAQPEVSDQDTTQDDTTDTGPRPVPCTPNTLCDDNNPCTYDDSCTDEGLCSGIEYACDDGRSCTDDICQGNGDCAFEIQDGTCLIGNICYDTGEQHVQNDCVACDPDISQTEWALTEDGLPCGDDEACLLAGSCTNGQCDGALIDCDDANPCTDDYCDVQDGCVNQNNFDPCNDGDACTLGDEGR